MAGHDRATAYAHYRRHGVREGTALSERQFASFWRALPDHEREFWGEQFESGPTRLSVELLDEIDMAEFDQDDVELMARVRGAVRGTS
jgi:hypothetical protein